MSRSSTRSPYAIGRDLPFRPIAVRLRLRGALEQTFTSRKIQGLPTSLPAPPSAWAAPYARMIAEDELRWRDLAELTRAVQAVLDPVLGGTPRTWSPQGWVWSA